MSMAETGQTEYHVYCIRWFQLLVYVLVTLANGHLGNTFTAIEAQTASFFAITATHVNALVIVFLFLYVPGTVLSIWALRRFSIRTVMIIGALMNLGAWIRLFALISPSHGYAWLMVGQILPALSAPIFFNSVALFAARWFAPGQRDLATSIGSMANPLGLAVGSLLPSLIVTDDFTSNQFLILLASEAALATFTTVLVLIFYRSSPPTSPSLSNEQQQQQQPDEVKQDLLRLMTNRHYLILLFSFSIGLALFNALTSLLYQIGAPSGYSSQDAGVFGAVIIVAGLVSAGVVGVIMDRTHAYRLVLKVLLMGACGSSIYFIVILRPHMFYSVAVALGLMGLFLLPLLPVVFECAVECTYPIRAEWCNGILLCFGNVLGAIFILALDSLIQQATTYTPGTVFTPASIFIFCMIIIATIVLLFYNGPYLRLEAERVTFVEQSVEM